MFLHHRTFITNMFEIPWKLFLWQAYLPLAAMTAWRLMQFDPCQRHSRIDKDPGVM